MRLSKTEMLETVRRQLALDLHCDPRDFLRDGVVFCEAKIQEGRRPFDRQTPFLEVTTMGKSTVVSADAELLEKVKPLFAGKSRDEIFEAPFLWGHSIFYIPDVKSIRKLPYPKGLDFGVKEGAEIEALYNIPCFANAIQYDARHPRPDVLVMYAKKGHEIVGMAGASADCETMWQIGIDVIPQYREKGIAACLVGRLAEMIMERGKVPYYGTASSNIPSQATAARSGFIPAWMCSFRNTFDGSAPFGPDVKIILA
jgi:GNAT superfamily N-acetyltransferase